MVPQGWKDFYYLTAGKCSIASYWRYSLFPSKRFHNALLHIGCGTHYIPEMVNVDGNLFQKKDLWLDVAFGLPFKAGSIRGVYISHVLEHFKSRTARKLLQEFHRVLAPQGFVRIVVPSLEYAVEAYARGDPARLSEWPERYRSIGGRFHNFLLCANQHFTLLDFSFLEELLTDAGFRNIVRRESRRSSRLSPEHLRFEPEEAPNDSSLYVECEKP